MDNKDIGIEEDFEDIVERIAFKMLFFDSLTSLRVWWSHKFNKPFFHDNLGDYTPEELLIEWYIHKLLNDHAYRQECENKYKDGPSSDEDWLKDEMGIDYFNTLNADETLNEEMIKDFSDKYGV